jgi:sugar lactone lactonase YvrE
MSLETFEAGYAGARPPRKGTQWSGVWRLQQQVDRIIDTAWPQPWGLAGARSDFPIFSIADQETTSTDVFFKSDGTKFYIVGSTNDTVYQYSCSTAWDINTASYDSKSFSVTTQETNPTGLFFKSDGTTFYILGSGSDAIYQYSCSTAWDVSTASYDSKSFSVNAQESGPTGLFFKDDGTKFYIIGSGSDTIYQYSCSTAWDVSTASYDSKSFSVTTQETTPTGLFFKDDGTKFYIVGTTNDTVYQYSCSTAWDVSTASYDSKSFSVGTQETSPGGLFFKSDGTKFYIIGNTNDTVLEYSLLTPWDVSTAYAAYFYVGGQDGSPQDLTFKTDGTKFYIVGATNDTVYQYSCSTAWDVSTASYDSKSFSVTTQETNPTGLFFKSDGTKFYIIGNTNDTVYQYSCSTAWDISTASYDSKSFSVVTQDNAPTGIFFKDDGTKFYIVGNTNDTVYQYSCSTAWDISTASYDSKSFSVVTQDNAPTGIFFKDDGTKFYIVGITNDTVYQYSCSTAWDVSTASYDSKSFSVNTQENAPQTLFFKSDGTKFYIVGTGFDTVYQYSLLLE